MQSIYGLAIGSIKSKKTQKYRMKKIKVVDNPDAKSETKNRLEEVEYKGSGLKHTIEIGSPLPTYKDSNKLASRTHERRQSKIPLNITNTI